MKFETTAEQDRHYICEIGRLFWGDNKQCYSAYAVFRRVKRFVESQAQPQDSAGSLTCPKCGMPHMIVTEKCRADISCGFERRR